MNNPSNYIDVNGDSVWVTQTRSVADNGDVTLNNTVHITGKVLKTGTGSATASGIASGLNERLNAQSSTETNEFGNGNTVTVNTKIQAEFKPASSMSDVSDIDHLVVIVDNVEGKADPKLGGGEAAGRASVPGQIAYIESRDGVETAFHEVGHNLGLQHPDANNSGDPMSYTGRGSNFSTAQMSSIRKNAASGAANYGSNSALMSDAFPNLSQGSFNATTTNSKPFQIAPSQRARIPLPIRNRRK